MVLNLQQGVEANVEFDAEQGNPSREGMECGGIRS
jgi:hypothetical protein